MKVIIDEWGTWFTCEPGTNPGFLYQQNTMRDALVAGISLNIFNKHSDRIRMANIAQMVNVLQSVILTEGDKMILTPTYHVFDMYKEHQNSLLLDSFIETKVIGIDQEYMVANLTESASIDEDGVVHITITNLSIDEEYPINAQILGKKIGNISGQILHNSMKAMNTFENPNVVRVEEYTDFKSINDGIQFTIPPCSVIHITIE